MYARTFIANIRWCIDRFYDFTIQARQEQSSRCVHPRRNRLLADKKGSQYSIQPPPRTSTRLLIPSTTSAGPVACESTGGLWTATMPVTRQDAVGGAQVVTKNGRQVAGSVLPQHLEWRKHQHRTKCGKHRAGRTYRACSESQESEGWSACNCSRGWSTYSCCQSRMPKPITAKCARLRSRRPACARLCTERTSPEV